MYIYMYILYENVTYYGYKYTYIYIYHMNIFYILYMMCIYRYIADASIIGHVSHQSLRFRDPLNGTI